jgi:23S rRNA (uridine2552-2'-O)-methyltransferase
MKKVKDYYYQKAKKENYSARSVYKLKEINSKKHFLKLNQKILELGAAPGSWSEYTSKIIGNNGLILGIDLKERPKKIADNAPFIQGDVFEIELSTYRQYAQNYSGIISDMAPNTTGHKNTDHLQSVGLCEKSLYLSLQLVKKGGYLLVKIFQGSEFESFISKMKTHYKNVSILKPNSSRKESREIFILGLDKKEEPNDFPKW